MIEDQIKAIAEEYARLNPPSTTDEILKREVSKLNAEQVFEPFLHFLNDRYCVIEKRIVIDEYNKTLDHRRFRTTISKIRAAARRRFLQFLFGTSMFNQDEE